MSSSIQIPLSFINGEQALRASAKSTFIYITIGKCCISASFIMIDTSRFDMQWQAGYIFRGSDNATIYVPYTVRERNGQQFRHSRTPNVPRPECTVGSQRAVWPAGDAAVTGYLRGYPVTCIFGLNVPSGGVICSSSLLFTSTVETVCFGFGRTLVASVIKRSSP